MANRPKRYGPQELVFLVVERLCRCHDDRLSRVDPHRVEIFHVAHGNAVIKAVPDYFVFNFFPSFENLFDKDLTAVRKCFAGSLAYVRFISTNTGTEST